MQANPETVASVAILAFATAVATNYVALPFAALSSPLAIVIMVIGSLGMYNTYPAAGLALFLLTAVLFFKRNAQQVVNMKTAYGDATIPSEAQVPAVPYGSASSQPRNYDQFKETDPANPMLGPLREGFASAEGVVDVPEAYGAEAGAPIGSFPIGAERPSGTPEMKDFMYRPEPDTGFNEFERFGPDIDEKKKAIVY